MFFGYKLADGFTDRVIAQLWKAAEFQQPSIAPLLDLFPVLLYIPAWLPLGSFWNVGRRYKESNAACWKQLIKESAQQKVLSSQSF